MAIVTSKIFGIVIKITKNNTTTIYSNMPNLGLRTSGTPVIGIASNSQKLDITYASNGAAFGECNSSQYEVELFNLPPFIDLYGARIALYKVANLTDTTLPANNRWFVGTINSSSFTKNDGTSQKIIAYDDLYNTRLIDVSPRLGHIWTNDLDSHNRIELGTFRNKLTQYVGLASYLHSNTINENVTINPYFSFEKVMWLDTELANPPVMSFGDALRMIGEAQGAFIFVYVNDSAVSWDNANLYVSGFRTDASAFNNGIIAFNDSEFSHVQSPKIDGFFVYDTKDICVYKYPANVQIENCKNPYVSMNNRILVEWALRNTAETITALENLANKIIGTSDTLSPFEYTNSKIHILAPDRIHEINTNSQLYTVSLGTITAKWRPLRISYYGSQLSEATIYSPTRPYSTQIGSSNSEDFSRISATIVNSSEVNATKIKMTGIDGFASLYVDNQDRLVYTDSRGNTHILTQ